MEVSIIIGLVLYAVCIFLIIKFVKNILVAIGTVLLFSVLFVAGTGFFIYGEVTELQQEFPVSNNLILLRDNDRIVAGLVLLPSEEFDIMNGMRFLNNTYLDNFTYYISSDNEDAIFDVVKSSDFLGLESIESSELKDETYKIIFIELSVIEDSPLEYVDFAAVTGLDSEDSVFEAIFKSDLLSLFESDNPWDDMIEFVKFDNSSLTQMASQLEERYGEDLIFELDYVSDPREDVLNGIRYGLVEQFGDDDLKGFMFLLTLASISTYEDAEGVKYLFSKYKDEEIYIRDTSILFDLLRLSPNALIDAVVSETSNAAQEVQSRVESEIADED